MKIFVLVDAMRSDYISKKNTPFLYSLSKKYFYIKKVKPSLGFCERSEIISGLNYEKTGYFTAIGRNKQKSEYKKLSNTYGAVLEKINSFILLMPKIYFLKKRIDLNKIYKKYLNKILQNQFHSKMPIYNIPINQLKKFYLTEDELDHFSDQFYPKNSLIKKLQEKNYIINKDSWTYLGNMNQMNQEETMQFLKRKNKESNKEFIFSYIGLLDVIGHRYGPKSSEMKKALTEIDSFFEKLYNTNIDNTLIILGDHGMKTIKKTVNIYPLLKNLSEKFNLKINKDYNFFIDSTMLRIWIHNDQKDAIIKYINKQKLILENGAIISDQIKVDKKIYGDFIWLANEGTMIFPDFFHFNIPAGMHGYDNNKESSFGTCIIYSKDGVSKKINEISLSDINSIIDKEFI